VKYTVLFITFFKSTKIAPSPQMITTLDNKWKWPKHDIMLKTITIENRISIYSCIGVTAAEKS